MFYSADAHSQIRQITNCIESLAFGDLGQVTFLNLIIQLLYGDSVPVGTVLLKHHMKL